MSFFRDLAQRIGKTKGFAAVGIRAAPPIDRFVSTLTGGKKTLAGTVLPTFILVHRGRKSGREIRTPLSYIRASDGFALAGTNFGQKHHPHWSANLIANPNAAVIIGGEHVPVTARLAGDEEKARLWKQFVEMWPAYDTYVDRSGRNIRVFVLERRPS